MDGGFLVYKALKPDLIVEDPDSTGHGEYKICSLTSAVSEDDKAIADAIRRTGHSIEFTAFLRERLEGLEVVRDLARATGADQAATADSDLAETARLDAAALRILAAPR